MDSPGTTRRKVSCVISEIALRVGALEAARTTARVIVILVMLSALILIAPQPAFTQTLTVLHSFGGNFSDGKYPSGSVIFDKHGRLVGTTQQGGFGDWGTVFAVTKKGKEKVLHTFAGLDGGEPMAGLVRDKLGNLYGTAGGGAYGYGTVFKLTPDGTETVLYSFGSQPGDGAFPQAALILDKAGNLYGTAYVGGAYGCGTVFEVTPDGTETVLHSFGGQSGDGVNPAARLVFDKHGNLYGTASEGGAYGYGTIFKLTPDATETVLYSFGSQADDGAYPFTGLIFDKKRNLYGTTTMGGNGGCYGSTCGTVFELSPSDAETVLYRFGSQPGDGSYPLGDLVFDKQGNLYGTTFDAAGYTGGNVFKLSSSGNITILHSFTGGDGWAPWGGMVFDSHGNLYGTTTQGGAYGRGTLFKLSAQ